MRTLTITIVAFNVTFGAAWSVLVLYASDRLGLGAIGFGLLTTASAVGGVLGSWSYGWIERRVSLGDIMRVGLIIETFTHLTLALTTSPGSGDGGVLRVRRARRDLGDDGDEHPASGRADGVPGPRRQRLHDGRAGRDRRRLGRRWRSLARIWGVTGPFWFAFVGSALILAAIWRELANIAHAE